MSPSIISFQFFDCSVVESVKYFFATHRHRNAYGQFKGLSIVYVDLRSMDEDFLEIVVERG